MKLTIKDIYKSFGEKNVLKGISFEAESGKSLGILGRNGAGKTTTIRIIMGVFKSDGGEILLDGKPLDRRTVKIGYLPEERGMYPKKTINEQMLYFAKLNGVASNEAKKAIDYWLERLGMTEYKFKLLNTLSKGNQQKIQLASTLTSNPDIVILDEPFSGLDPVNALLLKDVIKELIKENKIVLFSSHQMNYIEEFCESIAIMNGGSIVLHGDLDKIKRSYSGNKLIIDSCDNEKLVDYLKNNFNNYTSLDIKESEVEIVLEKADDKAELLNLLSKSGIDIDRFQRWEPNLNDIFVEYAGTNI